MNGRDDEPSQAIKPDPTGATQSLVAQVLASIRELVEAKTAVTNARLEAADKASAAFREDLVRVPTTLDKALSEARTYNDVQFQHLKEHADSNFQFNIEKIKALTEVIVVFKQTVNERFQLGDIQTEKAARDVKSAVDAAFAAAKEAVGEQNKSNALSITKSETAFTKQIDQLADSVKSIVKNTDDKIGDIKERLLAIESRGQQSDQGWKSGLSVIAVLISLAGVVTSVAVVLIHR